MPMKTSERERRWGQHPGLPRADTSVGIGSQAGGLAFPLWSARHWARFWVRDALSLPTTPTSQIRELLVFLLIIEEPEAYV